MKFLDLFPWYVKYVIVSIVLVAYAPSWVAEKYDQRWNLNAAPHIKERDKQFEEMDKKLDRIEKSTFRIEGILMDKK